MQMPFGANPDSFLGWCYGSRILQWLRGGHPGFVRPILDRMEPPKLTEDDRDELTVLALLEILERFGDPVKRPAKVIPWRKSGKRPQSEGRGRH
jgi:hypothetical protein